MSIALERLTYTYMPDSPFAATAVRDVSFTVQDGDFFALIGHTGSRQDDGSDAYERAFAARVRTRAGGRPGHL